MDDAMPFAAEEKKGAETAPFEVGSAFGEVMKL
jgi:hypothetical protein